MQNFDLHKYLGNNPLLEDENSNSEDFLDLLFEVIIENYCEENNILRENLNENFLKKLKSKFSKLPSNIKSKIKSTIGDVKSKTKDVKGFFKDITSIPKDLDPQKLLRTIQILKTKKNLNEEDLGEFTSTEQIKSLKPGDTFTWKGKKVEDFTANDMPVFNDTARKEDGILKPNVIYVVSTPDSFEDGNGDLVRTPGFIGSKEYFEEVEKSPEGMWARKMFKKYPWTEKLLRVLFASIGVGGVALGVADIEKLGGGDENVSKGGEAGTAQDPYADFLDTGDGNALTDTDDVQTGNVKIIPTDASNSTSDNIVDKVDQALNDANVNIGDTKLNNTDTNSAAVQTYDVGEYQLSDGESGEIVKDLVTKTLQDLNQQLEDLKGKNVTSIDLDIDFGGTVSNQADGDSNQADDGSDLIDGRISTAEKISKQAGEQITKIVKNALGDDVKVNIDYNKVDTHSSVSNQTVQDAVDNMGTQSSFETVSIGDIAAKDVPSTETPNNIPNLIYNFLYTRYKPDDGKRLKPKDSPSSKSSTTTTTSTPSKPSKANFNNVNRNNQIATILGQINPKLDIYNKLENEGIKSELVSDLKDIRDNEEASKELKDLAILILSIRKNPSIFLDKISKATGIKFDTRAKAKMLGGGKKGKSAAKLGLAESIFTSIKEGVVADRIEQAISDSDIASKRDEVIALLGSMYKSSTQKDGKRLSILNIDTLKPNELEKLKGLGFSTKDKSGRYIFMDSEEEVGLEKGKEKGEEENGIDTSQEKRVKAFFNKKPNLKRKLKLIDRNVEVAPVIIALFLALPDKLKKKSIIVRMVNKMLGDDRLKTLDDKEEVKEATERKATQDVVNVLDIFDDYDQLKVSLSQLLQPSQVIDVFFEIFLNEMPGITRGELEYALKQIKMELSNVKGEDAKAIEAAFSGLGITQKGEKEKEIETPIWNASQEVNYTLTEGLTEDESKAVLDKYKQRYAAVLKSNPDFIKKYPNPDKVIYGMAIKEITKLREKLGKNADLGDHIEDFTNSDAPQFQGKSDKKKKQMATAAFLKKEKQKLDEIDAMMEDAQEKSEKNYSNYFKKMDKNRLNELVKAALMGPIPEKQASTDKYDDNPGLKGKQSKLPDALQKGILGLEEDKIDETDMSDRIIDKTLNKVQDGENLLHKLIKKLKTLPNTSAQQIISQLKLKMTPAEVEALEEGLRESFKSLSKDLDKQKGVDKEYAGKIAGKIANIKRKGGGKGPTAKQKKRMAETILKELRK